MLGLSSSSVVDHVSASKKEMEGPMHAEPPDSLMGNEPETLPVRLLLLDDDPTNLVIRATVLRKHGYQCLTAASYEEAITLFDQTDIAVLDYHLGTGKFGSDVAALLRKRRPEVPIIILSATLEHYFGGTEDMHLLKGYSSNDNLVAAIQSLDAKRKGSPVVVDAAHFFYSRLSHALGNDLLIQVFSKDGHWLYCNDAAADYLGRDRDWFPGRSIRKEMPYTLRDWQKVVEDVVSRRETYVDRSRQGLLNASGTSGNEPVWSVQAFPIVLHDGNPGVVLTARVLPTEAPSL